MRREQKRVDDYLQRMGALVVATVAEITTLRWIGWDVMGRGGREDLVKIEWVWGMIGGILDYWAECEWFLIYCF